MTTLFIFIKVIAAICLLGALGVAQSSSSSDIKRYEIGGLRRADADTVLEILHRSDPAPSSAKVAKLTELGLGGRFGVNITKNIDVEVEANIFPEDKQRDTRIGVPVTVLEPGGRKFQMLFGPRMGLRFSKFGVFGKVRPGFIRVDRYEAIDEIFKTPGNLAILSRYPKRSHVLKCRCRWCF